MIVVPGRPVYKGVVLVTRRGNPIENRQEIDFCGSERIPDYRSKHRAATMRNEPNPYYNCHGMTFASSRTRVFDGSIGMILADDGYTEVTADEALPGDVVLYYNAKGEINHSGIITTSPSKGEYGFPWVVSKWGMLNEVHHLAYDVPPLYQPVDNLRYWRITK